MRTRETDKENPTGAAERSDAELLLAFTKGDAAALEELVERYRQSLFAWLVGMTGNRADAEDLFQDVWLRIIRHADHFNDISFRAWMWQIARNLLIDFRRKRKPDVSLDATDDEDDQPLLEQLVSDSPGPREQLTISDNAKRMMEEVRKLPAVQREVLLMRIEGEMPFNEIAKTLGIPLNTALGRMHDAVTKLRKIMEEDK